MTPREALTKAITMWGAELLPEFVADAAIAMLESAGYVIVSKVPTEEMVEAGIGAMTRDYWRDDAENAWAAMIEGRSEETGTHNKGKG